MPTEEKLNSKWCWITESSMKIVSLTCKENGSVCIISRKCNKTAAFAQTETIMVHKLCHIVKQDNFVNWYLHGVYAGHKDYTFDSV
jgi:hypothetical protein